MPHRILAIGDSYLSADRIRSAIASTELAAETRFDMVDPADRPPLTTVHEYQGSPAAISAMLTNEEVLLVHAAAVTAEILDAHPHVRLIACARGNPVNVDLDAARARGVAVACTPAKNADSVADLTIAMTHMLFRGMLPALRWIDDRARSGETTLDSTFIGGDWMAREPRGHTMGLIGLGAIGERVARRSQADGLRVLAYDPHYRGSMPPAELVGFDELLAASDIVSLHAKLTPDNHHMVNEEAIGKMKPGAYLVNTAREGLLDEDAVLRGISSGQLGGAALDVMEPSGRWPELQLTGKVIITPHLGGATAQTQDRGLAMLLDDIRRFFAGEELVNPAT